MSDYRRWRVPGGTVFLTIVTYGRRPILTTDLGRHFLRQAFEQTRERYPFELFASVLLPDHLHLVMCLPEGDADYSLRVRLIKEAFTIPWLDANQPEAGVTPSQQARGERGVWQPRFWEHTIDSEEDLAQCVDYLHWNPRKHHLVDRVRDYPWSSFHRFVQSGDYPIDWGGIAPAACQADADWGEPST